MDAASYPFVLRERLGNQGVAALFEVLTSEKADIMTLVVDTFERRLAGECGKLRAELRDEMTELRSELSTEMKELRVELRADFKVEVANVRADLLKWSFVFWTGQVAVVCALMTVLP